MKCYVIEWNEIEYGIEAHNKNEALNIFTDKFHEVDANSIKVRLINTDYFLNLTNKISCG